MPQGAAAIKSIFLVALLWPTCSLADCTEVLLQMARDMTRPHDAVPSGVPDADDWQTVPRLGMGKDPANFTALIAWRQVYTQGRCVPCRQYPS